MRVADPDRRNLLDGRVGLVTGGAGSLGLAIARLFLKEGARVVLFDRDAGALAAVAARLDDVNVSTLAGDVTSEDDVAAAVDSVVERHGRLDVLVTVAGAPPAAASLVEFDTAEFDRILAVHVRGVFLAGKHGLRALGEGGSLVIVSGVSGLRGGPGMTAYAAAEHAQVGLMRAMTREAAARGVRVNTVHAGPVANGFQDAVEEQLTPVLGTAAGTFLDRRIPLRRHAQPEEVARSVLYLASRQSSFTTGSTLVVDGGLSV